MNRDWKRLARATRTARNALGLNQEELAEAAGIGRATLQRIEKGDGFNRMPQGIYKVGRFFGWPPDGPDRILAGEDLPATREEPPDTTETPREKTQFARGLSRRTIEEIGDGEVLEDLVLELARATKHTSLVLILKRDGEAPEDDEAVKADLKEWSRVRKAIERAARGEHDPSESA